MREISASKFKATCLKLLDEVQATGEPLVVTKYGKPVAQLAPLPETKKKGGWLGCMAGEMRIIGDIMAPACDLEDWDALKP